MSCCDAKSPSCSCEDCTEPLTCLYYDKRKNIRPAKPSDFYGHMIDTLSQQKSAVQDQKSAYLPQSKGSCCPADSKRSKSPAKRTGSQSSDIYGLMADTLSRQESAVEDQKKAYLPQSKGSRGSCSVYSKRSKSLAKRTGSQPSGIYGLMVDTLLRQESAVEDQKRAYLPQSKGSRGSYPACSKRSKSPAKRTGSQPSDIYGLMVETLSRQESAVEDQKIAYFPQSQGSKSSCCPADSKKSQPAGVYGIMIDILTQQESAVEVQKNAYLTDDSTKCICNASGYVFEIPKYEEKRSPCPCSSKSKSGQNNKQVYNVTSITSGINSVSYKNCSECSQLKYESPKCSAESKRYKSIKNAQELFKNILQTQANEYQHERDECDSWCPQYNAIQHTNKIVSESRGYVFELPNDCQYHSNELPEYSTTPNKRESVINTGKVNVNTCQVKWSASDPHGFVLKPRCNDEELAKKNMFESSGYVVDLPKIKKCACSGKKSESCSSDNKLESGGYVVELQTDKEKRNCAPSSDNKSSGYVLELKTNKKKCTSCSDNKSESSGYAVDLSIKKEEKKCASCRDNKLSRYVLELKTNKEKKKYSSCCDNKLSRYVLELKTNKENKKWACIDKLAGSESKACASGACMKELLKSLIKNESTHSIQSKCSNCESNNISLDRRTTSSSGSCNGMTRSKESPCTCLSRSKSGPNNKNVFYVSSVLSATNPRSYKNCTECSRLKYESPKYFTESKRYKPTKNAQELFRNILQTQAYKYQNERDKCDTYTNNVVSESRGYVLELPKYTHNLTLQSDCHSNKFHTSDSNLSGYVPELREYLTTPNKRESVMNTGEVNVNTCQVKWIATDPNNLVLKAQCHDAELAKKNMFESSGYVVEMPKTKKCACIGNKKSESCSSDNKFESGGYVVELPKVKEKRRKCNCNRHKHATKAPSEKKSTCKKCTKSASTQFIARAPPKCTENPPSQNNSCVFCKADTNRLSSTANPQKIPSWQSDKQQKSCEYAESVSQHYACEMKSNDLPGYVFEIPKHTRNSCTCKKPRKKNNQSNTQYICQNVTTQTVKAHKSFSSPTNIYTTLCNKILKKQTETIEVLKEVYLPGKKTKTMKFQLNILKNQANHVADLNNIYLHQNQFELPTKTWCTPLPNVTEPLDGETEILSAGDYSNECLACKPTKSSENNINRKQADTVERLKKTYLPEKSNDVKFELQTDTCCIPSDERIEKRSAKEFGGSIESDSSYTKKKISKCDLLKRIRDVYEACSCKICECTPNKTAHECHNLCEYDECLSPILSYGMNQWQICGCKPCDCVQCVQTMNVHHCQTLMVAPVEREANVSRLECTCSPCPCFECGLIYPLDSHVVNEMSTSINMHALCKCEDCLNDNCDRNGVGGCTCHKPNKITSKPVEPDTHDFDIRTTTVVYDKAISRQVGRNDTMPMCVAVPNRHPSFDDILNNTQTCRCKECECIYCVAQKTLLTTL